MKKIMRLFRLVLPLLVLIVTTAAGAQKIKKADRPILAGLRNHIEYLASDALEGRRTGTQGEKLAMEYISQKFKEAGLIAKGTSGYYQSFEINEGKQIGDNTFLSINDMALIPEKDFFPLPYSPGAELSSTASAALREVGLPWLVDLHEPLAENQSNPHFDIDEYIKNNTQKAADRGAAAIILYNSSSKEDHVKFNGRDRSPLLPVPVIYVSKEAAKKYFSDESASLKIKMKIDIGEKTRTGSNVIGYIDNGAATTVVLGAHFDHLGYGEDGNSMLRTGEKQIHNGADDNASGTAGLIELARILKKSKARNNNYLFIAFSGEELGLYGSKYFTENPTIDLNSISFMINMDMIGRLNDSSKTLTVGGYGTSPVWGTAFSSKTLKRFPLTLRFDSSGTGPSDHTSFYRKDIPVLFYFTGLHSDYHKPSDDYDKINYRGLLQIVKKITTVVEMMNDKGKLAFSKTREAQTTSQARFSVTLGIMPDYTYSGEGVRLDGVTEGRPAQKAGIRTGDIILRIGDYAINSMENYMQALGKFKKADKAMVTYRRGSETLQAEVEF
jgi:aminopeptidase YwaD